MTKVAAEHGNASDPRVGFWLNDGPARPPLPALEEGISTDLLVVGGGYTGLWTALHAKRRHPDRSVALIEQASCGWAASGRNGGFVASSLTHGIGNGHTHWPGELAHLEQLGMRNLDELEAELAEEGIECDFERVGKISVATRPHEVAGLEAAARLAERYGRTLTPLSAAQTRDRLDSPAFLAGLADPRGTALVHPARLAWGLRDACLEAGVRIFEATRATGIRSGNDRVVVATPRADITAQKVALATNAFPALLLGLSHYTVPVYDYAIVSSPLTAGQLDAIGWSGREGFTDSGNAFHYFRLTPDNRILWGGDDAIYHFGGRIDAAYDQRAETFTKLQDQFFGLFPQLTGLEFTHAWGGVIDTCTRFSAFFGSAHRGRVAYAMGFTGLGVGATRFAGDVLLDLLEGRSTERTSLEMVRRRPIPWPPEPLRWMGINITRHAMERADTHGGRRNLWLRTLDRFGVGFDS